jgi:hypothetical protein
MRRMRIHRRKVRQDRPRHGALALDPRDPDIVRAKTIGASGQRSPR